MTPTTEQLIASLNHHPHLNPQELQFMMDNFEGEELQAQLLDHIDHLNFKICIEVGQKIEAKLNEAN